MGESAPFASFDFPGERAEEERVTRSASDELERVLLLALELRDRGESFDLEALAPGSPSIIRRAAELLQLDDAMEGGLPPRVRHAAPPPTNLGPYRVLAPLGAGGMGQVYLAREEGASRLVAVKVLPPAGSTGARAQARFEREVRLTINLEHPHIVPVFGHGITEGWSWYAMRWLSGPDLGSLPDRLSPRDAARIGLAALRALECAHQAGVVHRDIKPSNIILDAGIPLLADFGLAHQEDMGALTTDGLVPGTLAFLPPERLNSSGLPSDPRWDLYSLGATLYSIVVGEPPFRGDTPAQCVHAILHAPLRFPSVRREDRDWPDLLAWMMERDPADRPPSAAQAAAEFERFLAGLPLSRRRGNSFSKLWRRATQRPALAWTTLLSIGLALLLGALLERRRSERVQGLSVEASAITAALEQQDIESARVLLESARTRHGDQPEPLQRAARQVEAWDALLALSDLVQDRSEDLDPAELKSRSQAVSAYWLPDHDRRLVRLSLAAASLHAGSATLLGQHLDELERHPDWGGASLATSALRFGKVGSSPAPRTQDPYEAVFAAIGLRIHGADPSTVEQVLESARENEPGSESVLYAKGILFLHQRQYLAAAATFESLSRLRRMPGSVQYFLARSLLELGERTKARARLAAIPPGRWTARAHQLHARILLADRDDADADAAMETAEALAPTSPKVRLSASRYWLLRGDRRRAERCLSGLAEAALTPVDDAALRLVQLQGELGSKPPTEASASLEDWLDRARELTEPPAEPETRSSALTLVVRLLAMRERRVDPTDLATLIEKALVLDPDNTAAHEQRLLLCELHAAGAAGREPSGESAKRALESTEVLLQARRRGLWFASDEQLVSVIERSARLCQGSTDRSRLRTLIQRVVDQDPSLTNTDIERLQGL